ncbi:DMP19 family protein [Jiangella anatolica]|nr:DUF4375 domain-containing protein [Jiangella anatolica]
MSRDLRQSAPPDRTGAGWYVFDHLWRAVISDHGAVEHMTPEQRTVLALNLLRTEVNSGGFDVYFRYSGGDHALDAMAGAHVLGPAWAALIHAACRTIGDPYPTDIDERERILGGMELEDPEGRILNELDSRLYGLEADEPADERIDAFVAAHWTAFFSSEADSASAHASVRRRPWRRRRR